MTESSTLLPQRATRMDAVIDGVNWLYEPYWPGDRLLARLADGRISLTDTAGERADEAFREAAEVLAHAIDAEAALLDGIWTAQPFMGNGDEAPDAIDMETRRTFVAIDLVELDGVSLQEIPYQERRRLLGSVIQESGRVRISPAVRLPLRPWLDAWRSHGFASYVAKHVNSRYRPGEKVEDWLVLPVAPEAVPSMARRLFGERPKKLPRIQD
jgi:bifunctional non-homologous end joining protein LigD